MDQDSTHQKPIEFEVKFITPLLIHGSNSRQADSIGLTGKALRGCWRFWFRAIVGGMIQGINEKDLLRLESSIFGSADEDVGARFRMRVELNSKPVIAKDYYLGFVYRWGNKKGQDATSYGYEPGLKYKITIIPRKNLGVKEVAILISSIWLWANLGGIGQRARRGFGSAIISSFANPDPVELSGLRITPEFSKPADIEKHLKEGLKRIWQIFKEWLDRTEHKNEIVGPIETNPGPNDNSYQNTQFFTLSSFGQIAIGQSPFASNDAIEKIHGNSDCKALGYIKPKRMASPVYTRLHTINVNQYVPVVTWSKQYNSGKQCLIDYFNNAECLQWLNGRKIS